MAKATITVLGIVLLGMGLWWATRPPVAAVEDARPASTSVVLDQNGSATVPVAPTDPAPTSTPLPAPTPTPTPEPVPFLDLIRAPQMADRMIPPIECGLTGGATFVDGTIDLLCIEPTASAEVVASADGRIVHIGREARVTAPFKEAGWSWGSQSQLGMHVVIDHGPFADAANVQTVYADLESIEPTLEIGGVVQAGQRLGSVAGPKPRVRFSLWVDNVRNDGAQVVIDGPDLEHQRKVAAALGPVLGSPTDPNCPLNLGSGALPGASRVYRNGTHQGIDFGCGTADRYTTAVADGTVVFLVDDYQDPTVPNREALLHNAALAGLTPHWTLVMLYGNVVVIDHGEIEGAGHVVTISAHLEKVDPAITLGAKVEKGTVLGEIGNRGTNASSLGQRGAEDPSLHLHWELFIDDWYLGSGQPPGAVVELITTAMCGAAETVGCP